MKTRKIWRLEDINRVGVYSSDKGHKGISIARVGTNTNRSPSPSCDPILGEVWKDMSWGEQERWYFGFSSLAQYKAWFFKKKARKALADGGILLRQYSVPADLYHRGMNQAIFVRSEATLVLERSPNI